MNRSVRAGEPEKGTDAFYKGEIAAAIVKSSEHLGGTLTPLDLAAFAPEWVGPISIEFRGSRVYELPPNGQEVAALETSRRPASPRRSAPERARDP